MPKKSLGQHFLTDPRILERLVGFSRVEPGDTVVEVGPGRGSLTRALASRVARVVTIEVDPDLVATLRTSLPPNVSLVAGDALHLDFRSVAPPGYRLVANLPYNVATPLIERFVQSRQVMGPVTILVQKEVADRILAVPGTGDYSPLTVGVQYYAEVERGFVLKPGAFSPPPKVESRVIRLVWKPGVDDNPGFHAFVRGVFGARRKTLANNLSRMYPSRDRPSILGAIGRKGHPDAVRAERLPIRDLEQLYREFAEEN